jgi:hypothetical protein
MNREQPFVLDAVTPDMLSQRLGGGELGHGRGAGRAQVAEFPPGGGRAGGGIFAGGIQFDRQGEETRRLSAIVLSAKRPRRHAGGLREERCKPFPDQCERIFGREDAVERRFRDHSEADAGHARNRNVEDSGRIGRRRDADDRRGVAGEHRPVRAEIAQGRRGSL